MEPYLPFGDFYAYKTRFPRRADLLSSAHEYLCYGGFELSHKSDLGQV